MNEQTIFVSAIERDSSQRPAFLDSVCGSDHALRRRVERLLELHDCAGSFLEHPAAGVGDTVGEPLQDRPGSSIGPYHLLEQIGEGGMGVVYLAEQKEPVRRKVALKVIKPGMDTRHVVARFEAERQALAMMNHSSIAKVLDAGATEAGRPYFVMELVKGLPITEFCDQHQLTTRERLELFITVCQAVQHAHQKGLIHRDLKPSNVLVEMHDVVAVPKVIDFGVAKAIGHSLTEKTLHTAFSQLVGTPLYMSPEQAGHSSIDVDTRSDIYSLGVLLYELLTGSTPFDRDFLETVGFDEMRRMIREVDPPRPSARVSTLQGQALSTISDRRQVEPRKLSQQLCGELDWIVMKALEKDRTRRYETATGLAADVQRYLNDEPVQACPPSKSYRFRKFARRNSISLMAAAVIAIAMLLGLVGTTWQAIRAMRAEILAELRLGAEQQARRESAKQSTEAEQQRKQAQANFQRALDAVDEMLTEVGQVSLANVPQMEPVRRVLLEKSLKFYEEFLQEKSSDVSVRHETGRAYQRVSDIYFLLGQHQQAEAACRQAIVILERLEAEFPHLPSYQHEVAQSYSKMGALMMSMGLTYTPETIEDAYTQATRRLETLVANIPDEPLYRHYLANTYLASVGRVPSFESQIVLLEKAIVLHRKLVADFPKHADYRHSLGRHYSELGHLLMSVDRLQEAEPHLREAISLQEKLVTDSADLPGYLEELAKSHGRIAKLLHSTGRNVDAERAWQIAEARQEKLIADFPSVPEYRWQLTETHVELAMLARSAGRYEETRRHFGRAADVYRPTVLNREIVASKSSDEAQPRIWLAAGYHRLARLLGDGGRFQEAIEAFDQSMEIRLTAGTCNNFAWMLATCPSLDFRDADRAVELAQRAVKSDPARGFYWNTLGVAHYRTGDWPAATNALKKSMELREGGDGFDWFFLAMAQWQLGEKDNACKWYEQALAWQKKNPYVEELLRFQAEAESLLKISDSEAVEQQTPADAPPPRADEPIGVDDSSGEASLDRERSSE